jgi:hypothetical protein
VTRRLILIGVLTFCIAFWTFLFYVLPWYIATGTLLTVVTLFVVLIGFELRGDIDRPSGEEMDDAPDLWPLPDRCLEADDPYQTRRAA